MVKYLETEQHIAPWSLDHPRNKGRNQKVTEISWKWKHNLSEPIGHKGIAKGKVYSHECIY
jgi:hypothetical protein